jgi:glycerol-3-phosphate O-acyltransferase
MAEKDLVKRGLTLGNRMYLEGEILRREAISKPVLQNALMALSDLGYLRNREGKLELAEAFHSLKGTQEAERAVSQYLNGFVEADG